MKTMTILAVFFLLMSRFAFSITPPAEVKKAFDEKFPNATKVKWGQESILVWEVEFKENGMNIYANFTENGTWIGTETQIEESELPQSVVDEINKMYPDWKIIKAGKTESPGKSIFYEVTIKSGKLKKTVKYTADGSPFRG